MVTEISNRDMISMKLLHYFITKLNYNPIIVQGVENEIWLQNLDEDYKVIRIVNDYIHNDEQVEFDVYKTKRMLSQIKRKTLTLRIKVLTILTDYGENVDKTKNYNGVDIVYAKDEKELLKNDFIKNKFKDLKDNLEYSEEGFQLFLKITDDINKKNRQDAIETDAIFKEKMPVVTFIILGIYAIVIILAFIIGPDKFKELFASHAFDIRNGQVYRLVTSAFLHISIIHFLCNAYSLYIIGRPIESFYGKWKYIVIYLFSAVTACLLSIAFTEKYAFGGSGAIFGLLGSFLYFGYHYRVYLGNTIKNQVIPIILINLIIGFLIPEIDNFAHIGGLIGGYLISMALGVNSKDRKIDHINGYILSLIYVAFLVVIGIVLK